jgi:hypothetical protein
LTDCLPLALSEDAVAALRETVSGSETGAAECLLASDTSSRLRERELEEEAAPLPRILSRILSLRSALDLWRADDLD